MSAKTVEIGNVTLTVRDIDAVASFYQQAIGLHRISGDAEEIRLGAGNRTLLTLVRDRQARQRSAREAGLFHTAFLLPSRGDLGRWIRNAIDSNIPVAGASDHGVSEALYLTDPESNGIEIYADRPRLSWRWNNGEVDMPSEHLAIEPILAAGKIGKEGGDGKWTGFPEGTTVGHMHLQVGNIVPAEAFYRDVLGFTVTSRYPGGSFYALDGYHHHLATNIWSSRGAGERTYPSTGLADFELITAPDFLDGVRQRADAKGIQLRAEDGRVTLRDPWNTSVTLVPVPQAV